MVEEGKVKISDVMGTASSEMCKNIHETFAILRICVRK
jgi:hypothetical protein